MTTKTPKAAKVTSDKPTEQAAKPAKTTSDAVATLKAEDYATTALARAAGWKAAMANGGRAQVTLAGVVTYAYVLTDKRVLTDYAAMGREAPVKKP